MREPDDEREPTRLIDDPASSHSLVEHLRAAADQSTRLQPHAVDRIERRLAAVSGDGASPAWRALRMPAYALAVALVAVVVWEHTAPRPVALVAKEVASMPRVSRPLQLLSGSLALTTDRDPAVVETPTARIEISPSSAVNITVIIGEHDVRIAVSSGSARVIYHDGVTQLVMPSSPLLTELASSSSPARPLMKHRTRPVSPAVVATQSEHADEPPALNPEQVSLDRALARLREAPEAALPLLDEHLQRFPTGITTEQAERARVAVLLRLSRRSEALAALDSMPSIANDLRVLRAELRCEANRHEEAIADFGAALVSGDSQFGGRALYGRAMCRQAMGEVERMTEDLDRYLALYPRGELADKARAERQRAVAAHAR